MQLPGFVDPLIGQAEVRDGRDVPGRNIPLVLAAVLLDLAPLVSGAVLIREPALGLDLISEASAWARWAAAPAPAIVALLVLMCPGRSRHTRRCCRRTPGDRRAWASSLCLAREALARQLREGRRMRGNWTPRGTGSRPEI